MTTKPGRGTFIPLAGLALVLYCAPVAEAPGSTTLPAATPPTGCGKQHGTMQHPAAEGTSAAYPRAEAVRAGLAPALLHRRVTTRGVPLHMAAAQKPPLVTVAHKRRLHWDSE